MRIRYIRDWANGNTNGSNSNWNEIGAYDYNNTNIALNKTVTPSKDGSGSVSASVVTDGSDDVAFAFSGLGNVTIDLGGIYDIDRIRIRRYFPSGNSTTQYHETKTEVSVNGQDWITVFDCAIEGKYYETSEGKIIKLKKEIDKLEENSSLKDVKDKVIEIENSLQVTKDYFKNVLIDKDIECNEIDGMLNLINKVKDISIGRKWASGGNIVGSKYVSISGYSYISTITISNLDFKPSLIYIHLSDTDRPSTVYDVELFGEDNFLAPYRNTQGNTSYSLRTLSNSKNNLYVNDTGFKLPIHRKEYSDTAPANPYTCVKWIAFE